MLAIGSFASAAPSSSSRSPTPPTPHVKIIRIAAENVHVDGVSGVDFQRRRRRLRPDVDRDRRHLQRHLRAGGSRALSASATPVLEINRTGADVDQTIVLPTGSLRIKFADASTFRSAPQPEHQDRRPGQPGADAHGRLHLPGHHDRAARRRDGLRRAQRRDLPRLGPVPERGRLTEPERDRRARHERHRRRRHDAERRRRSRSTPTASRDRRTARPHRASAR